MFTFIIPAHDEEPTVATIVRQACAAAAPGDRVLVVDSASSDDTALEAARAGAEVIRGPAGKGAAMNAALAQAETEWVCFLDADLVTSQVNIPEVLRKAATSAGGDADHIVGDYEYDYPGTILGSTFTVYEPLAAEFFPEIGHLGANSLTGYRAIRRAVIQAPLPADFGVETFLNISIAVSGGRASVCHLGEVESRYRPHGAAMPRAIGESMLNAAVAYGRLDPDARPQWEDWLDEGVAALTEQTANGGRSATLARLFTAVRRPMPARQPVRQPVRAP